jgi:hypothetical protein
MWWIIKEEVNQIRSSIMDAERKKSKAICDAYVLSKEISLAAKKHDSKYFDPIWLYEKVVALPEPPDARERRAAARAFLHAGQAMLNCARPDLAAEVFEKAVLLLQDSKSGALRSKAIAGVTISWTQMGKPSSGERFIARTLQHIEDKQGEKSRIRQEKQLERITEKSQKPKLPKRLIAPADSPTGRRKKKAHISTVLKKQS